MKNTRLYIIGNGFDLHHGLKTSYKNFATYLEKYNNNLYVWLSKYVRYSNTDKDLWSNFEANLAKLDTDSILDDNSIQLPNFNDDNLRYRDAYKFPDAMSWELEFVEVLFDSFREFILQTSNKDYDENAKIELDCSSSFLNFNYTNSLEEIYSIDRVNILYLHNSAFECDRVVLGHGVDPANFKDDLLDDLDCVEIPDWIGKNLAYDYPYDEGQEIIEQSFDYTFKPTETIIDQYKNYFESLSTINKVFVLGHSISEVDLPYFKEIANNVDPNAKWTISCFNDDEPKRFTETLGKLGVGQNNISFIKLEDIKIKNRHLKIDF